MVEEKVLKVKWIFVCRGILFVMGLLLTVQLKGYRPIRFEHYSIERGLSQNTVFAIIQDRTGFLWFGTEDGLNRYDGYRFIIYRHNPDDIKSISSNWVQTLYEGRSGTIWVGTDGGGLNRLDPVTGVFTRLNQPSTPGYFPENVIWVILGSDTDELWVGTDGGLYRVEPITGKWTKWTSESTEPNSLSCNRVKTICEDGNGGLWIGTLGGGLNHFEPGGTNKNGVFTLYSSQANDSLANIYSLYLTPGGILWIGTQKGIHRLNTHTKRFLEDEPLSDHPEYPQLASLDKEIIVSINADVKPGAFWIGSYGNGLFRFDPQVKQLENQKHQRWNPTSLSSNFVQTIFRDTSNTFWIGTDNGLNRLDEKKQRFGHWQVSAEHSNSLSNPNIWSIYKDDSGVLWVGTEEALGRLDREKNTCVQVNLGLPQEKESSKIVALCGDKNDILWVGTYGNGLVEVDTKQYRTRSYRAPDLAGDHVQTIIVDSYQTLWVGTISGLSQYHRSQRSFSHYKNIPGVQGSLSNNFVNVIYEDSSGQIWIGTPGGLNKIEKPWLNRFSRWLNETGNPGSLSHDNVTSIWEDQKQKGVLWIGTLGGGLNRFDLATGTFQHYLEKQGLTNGLVYGILGDEEGNLWLSTNRGIWKYDPIKKIFKNFNSSDGLQGDEFNSGAYFRSRDGELFFGGVNGFNAFFPRDIRDNPHIPPVVITGFTIMNEPVPIGSPPLYTPSITHTSEITLSYKDSVFSFDFAALDFTNPEKNLYAYKMEGFDRNWIYSDSKRRFATYTNLDPGEYEFRVIGSNNDGIWNKEGVSMHITIVPPFWKTWWFTVFMVFGFAILSYFTINFIKKYTALTAFWRREKYLGKYKLLEKIGSGGMGTIYKAQDTIDKNQLVALKVLREELFADEVHRKRFKQEAAIIDQLEHPNIVRVIERGQYKQKLFIAMELLQGKTLTKKIAESPVIRLDEILEILVQIMDALLKIHRHNIVHRDLKPDNIMLLKSASRRNYVKLLDFGLAKSCYQTRITQTGTVLGTINYMSPEQISRAEFSPASDIYAMGVIFYEIVTRHVPFPGERITDIMTQIMADTPIEPIRLRSDLPIEFNDLIMQMLAKKVEERPSGEDIFSKLRHIAANLPPEPDFEVTRKMELSGLKKSRSGKQKDN